MRCRAEWDNRFRPLRLQSIIVPAGQRKRTTDARKVLIYSRFPKARMLRFGERFELLNAAGKPPTKYSHRNSSRIFAR